MLRKLITFTVLFMSLYSNAESASWTLDSDRNVAYLGGSMIKPLFDSNYRGVLVKIDFNAGRVDKIFESEYVDNLSLSNNGNFLLFLNDENSLALMDTSKGTVEKIHKNVFGHAWSPELNQFIYRTYSATHDANDRIKINNAKLYLYDIESGIKKEVTGWVKNFIWAKHDNNIYIDSQDYHEYDSKVISKINPATLQKTEVNSEDILFSPDGKHLLIAKSSGEYTLPVKLSVANGRKDYDEFTKQIKDKYSSSSLTWLSGNYLIQSFNGYQVYSIEDEDFIYRNMNSFEGKSILKPLKTAMAYGANLKIVTYDYINNDWILENAATGEEYIRVNNTLFKKVDQCPRVRKGYTCQTRKFPQIGYPESK